MKMMKEYPDKHFELAICDPPYFKIIFEDGKMLNYEEYEEEKESEEYEICNCQICLCQRRVQSFGDVCLSCSSKEHYPIE